MGKNNRTHKSCNLINWLKQIFRGGSEKRARRVANYVFDAELTPKERDKALRTVIETIARLYPQNGTDAWLRDIRILARALTEKGLELRDATFINGVYSEIVDIDLSPYDKVRLYLLVGLFEHVGSDIAVTKRFCRVMYEGLTEQLAGVLCCGRQAMQEFASKKTPLFVSIIWESSHCPATDEYPYKKWINKLIVASCQGDEDVDAWLDGIFHILQLQKSHINIIPQTVFLEGLKKRKKTVDHYNQNLFDPSNPLMIVPDDLKDPLDNFLQTTNRKLRQLSIEASEWGKWFNMHRDDIREAMVKKRDDVIHRPTCGVRKDGYDNVGVSGLSVMSYLGIQSIAFHPNGGTFPDMDVAFTVKRMGCLLYTIRGSLEQMSLIVSHSLYEVCGEESQVLLQVIVELVIIEALHRIVVCDHSNSGFASTSGDTDGIKYRRDVPIRPHFPLLREGANTSKAATALCLAEMGCLPPKGRTYNSGHTPTGELIEVPSTPRFTLTNEELVGNYKNS